MLLQDETRWQPVRLSSKSGSSRRSSSLIGISQIGWLRLGQFPELPWHLCGILEGVAVILCLHLVRGVMKEISDKNKPVLQGVRPDGDSAKRSSDGGVVGEVLIGHHVELLVPSNLDSGNDHQMKSGLDDHSP